MKPPMSEPTPTLTPAERKRLVEHLPELEALAKRHGTTVEAMLDRMHNFGGGKMPPPDELEKYLKR